MNTNPVGDFLQTIFVASDGNPSMLFVATLTIVSGVLLHLLCTGIDPFMTRRLMSSPVARVAAAAVLVFGLFTISAQSSLAQGSDTTPNNGSLVALAALLVLVLVILVLFFVILPHKKPRNYTRTQHGDHVTNAGTPAGASKPTWRDN